MPPAPISATTWYEPIRMPVGSAIVVGGLYAQWFAKALSSVLATSMDSGCRAEARRYIALVRF
jgi:hypothetical protein